MLIQDLPFYITHTAGHNLNSFIDLMHTTGLNQPFLLDICHAFVFPIFMYT